jgi:hypothetical protein
LFGQCIVRIHHFFLVEKRDIFPAIITNASKKDQSFHIVLEEEPFELPEEQVEIFWIPMVSIERTQDKSRIHYFCLRIASSRSIY